LLKLKLKHELEVINFPRLTASELLQGMEEATGLFLHVVGIVEPVFGRTPLDDWSARR